MVVSIVLWSFVVAIATPLALGLVWSLLSTIGSSIKRWNSSSRSAEERVRALKLNQPSDAGLMAGTAHFRIHDNARQHTSECVTKPHVGRLRSA
jgi:hypothetical protein